MNKKVLKEFLDDKTHRLGRNTAAPGGPFQGPVTSGITKSCIRCGKHRLQSDLRHWRGHYFQCKDGCK